MARPWRLLPLLALLGCAAGPARAALLYSHPGALDANDNGLGTPLPGLLLQRDDAAADTLYFRFVARPQSDVLDEGYLAGLQWLTNATTAGLGVGNAFASAAYGAFSPSLGELDLASASPDAGLLTQTVHRGDVTRVVVRVKYNAGALDDVRVWLAPDSTLAEGAQPPALTTSFLCDASFQSLAVREQGGGAGWSFADLAVATRMPDLFGPMAFTDVTPAVMADTSASAGVSWGDYDGDGDLDVCVANGYAASHLFRNDGGGLFDDDPVPAIADLANADAMAWADFDNDGDLDVYVAQYALPNHLLRNDGNDTFTDVTAGVLGDAGPTTAAIWGDYDNDGRVDLYLTDFGGANKLLHNQGGGTFTNATSGPLAGLGASMGAAWGDFDGDGDLDLYVANFNKPNQLFRNDGHGVFADVTSGPLADAGHGISVAWGDFDGDGDLDLFLVNDGEPCRLLRNDGPAGFADGSAGPLALAGPAIGVAVADADDDGDLDVFLTEFGEPNRLLRNDGGRFSDAGAGALAEPSFCTGAAWGDYDGDGDPDLYVASDGGANRLLRNDQASGNHWLEVRLHGTVSNRAAIGARVKLVAGGRTQIRVISGGSGYGSQDALMAQFGLGPATHVDSLVVRWPSGIVQWLLPAPSVDRAIVVTEALTALAVGDGAGAGAHVALAPASPNPFRTSTRIAYELPRAGGVKLTVNDVQGRRVALLADDTEPAGQHSLQWSGKDASGHAARPGLYWVRLTLATPQGRETKVTKLALAR